MADTRVDELFDAAQAVPAAQRASWLRQACGDDAVLRRKLERLLAADAHGEGVLESGPTLIAKVLSETPSMPEAFGSWRVKTALGAGGMGEVWLAERDGAGFVQRAAIKQVAYPTPGLLQRFERERAILARLEHPGIARLIDGGVDAAGSPYLAMEYVEGKRIDQWIREHQLDVRATVKLLLQVCDTVQYAHRNLVVHSDIKPSNILVDADGKPRLLDFGIAKVLSQEEPAGTHTTTQLMTPDYAAPEWLAGAPATTAVDVYALGVLAYELMAGDKPYRLGRGGAAASALTGTTITAPSQKVAASLPDGNRRKHALRGDLDRVVMTAMAADPARRYATVEALAADLRCWLDGRAVAARGDSAWYRLRKFVARNRVATATVVMAVLALLAATIFSLHQAGVATRQATRAKVVRQFLADTFAQIDPTKNEGRKISLHDLLQQSEQRLSRSTGVPVPVRADLSTLIGTFYWNVADNVSAERMLKSVLELGKSGAVDDEVMAKALLVLSQVEGDRGDNDDAYAHASQAHALALREPRQNSALADAAQRALVAMSIDHDGAVRAEIAIRALLEHDRAAQGEDSLSVMNDLLQLGQALKIQGRFAEAESTLAQAAAIARKINDDFRSRLGLALDIQGEIQTLRGNYDGASRTFTEVLAMVGRLWGMDNVRANIVRRQLQDVDLRQGQFEGSLAAIRRISDEALRHQRARPDHYFLSLMLRADAQLGLGQLVDAEQAYHKALEQAAVDRGNAFDPSIRVSALVGLARVWMLQGRHAEAVAQMRRVVAIDRTSKTSESYRLALDLGFLGEALRRSGNVAEALQNTQAAAAMMAPVQGCDSPGVAQILAWRAAALLDAGRIADARQNALAAQAMAERVLPADNWQRAGILEVLARVELAAGDVAGARKTASMALQLRSPRLPASDPRVSEIQTILRQAAAAQDQARQG